MTDFVQSFVDGNVLTAAQMNAIRAADTGSLTPVNDATSNYEANTNDIGESAYPFRDTVANFHSNPNTLNFDFSTKSTFNTLIVGDYTIASGKTLTVTSGSAVKIL